MIQVKLPGSLEKSTIDQCCKSKCQDFRRRSHIIETSRSFLLSIGRWILCITTSFEGRQATCGRFA